MKTKIIIAIIAVVAIFSFGATRVHVKQSSATHTEQGTLGGLAADDK